MKCLVVTTHPLTNSLCKLLTDQVVSKLDSMGHEVILEDLYSQNFNPVLTIDERKSYYAETYDISNISEQVNRLQQADALVLVFPTWWFGFPAMLKGWFDRIWGPGITYEHANDFGPIKPRLTNLKKVLVVTTLGSPWWVDHFLLWQPVKRVVKIAILGTCARNSKLKFLSLYNSEKLSEQAVLKFTRKIERVLNSWKS
ncbi:MAG: NAD(P)H-dependent oxidoreductase [Gammaproteobacteria bacterium]|nr:NAD(P)H-dependent oxidoreductase [Gammaproteobacteria bacterium]